MSTMLERYAAGERSFVGIELDDKVHDFAGVDLSGADFSRSYIFADFRGANLSFCNFSEANVKTCDFRGANLQGALFEGAAICSAEFEGANLAGASFVGAHFHSHVFQRGELP
jgi:uncharacterized protein YjbI with pentapeptide repeats